MPLPPPPAVALISTGIADLRGLAREPRRILVVAVVARHQRHAGLAHDRLGGGLGAHRRDRRRRRPDEHDARRARTPRRSPRSRTGSRSRDGSPARRSAFAIARIALAVEVALARRRRAEAVGLVAGLDVQRVARRRRSRPRPCATPSRARGARDAAGDLAAVGDQDLAEHVGTKVTGLPFALTRSGPDSPSGRPFGLMAAAPAARRRRCRTGRATAGTDGRENARPSGSARA